MFRASARLVLLLALSTGYPASAAESSEFKLHASQLNGARLTRPAIPSGTSFKTGVAQFDPKQFQLKPLMQPTADVLKQQIALPEPAHLSSKMTATETLRSDASPVDYTAVEREYAAAAPPSAVVPGDSPTTSSGQGAASSNLVDNALAVANTAVSSEANQQSGGGNPSSSAGHGAWQAGGLGPSQQQEKNQETAIKEAQKYGTLISNKEGTMWSPTGKWAMGPDGKVYSGATADILKNNPQLGAPNAEFAKEWAKLYGPQGYRRGSEYTPISGAEVKQGLGPK
jgi:hypothetical protein